MRSVTKSRNGCARCKRQKVRCDQAKPSCGRCSRVGVECPGYNQSLKWSTKYERLNQQHGPSSSAPRASPKAMSIPLPLSSPDARNLSLEDLFAVEMPDLLFPGFMLDSSINFSPPTSPRDVPSPHILDPLTPATDSGSHNTSVEDRGSQAQSKTGNFPAPIDVHEVTCAHASGPLKRSLSDVSTVLTEFYFKEAASLYSVYDSPMNPFRSTVAQLWKSSRLLHCTLQSMSAACLLDNFPHLATVGKEMRREAISILKTQQEHDHASLLALLMLGGSSSWHDSSRTGAEFFNLARRQLNHMVSTGQLSKDSNNYHFFEEALIYWELLLAYVDDDVARATSPEESTDNSIYFPSRHIPHPWTGVARDTQVTVQEIGRLTRRCRVLARSGTFATKTHIEELQRSLSTARKLEERLLRFVYPDEKDVISPGDRVTPVWHLLTLAEVYRRTGLTQLYRVFPDLLDDRLRAADDTSPIDEWLCDDYSDAPHDNHLRRNDWLTAHVLETLRMLETIPIESGTRDFQPFLLVALCSELRLPVPNPQQRRSDASTANQGSEALASPSTSSSIELDDPIHHDSYHHGTITSTPPKLPELSMRSIEIVRTRQFVLDRLKSFIRILPPKPMKICIQIVEESWSRIDDMQNLTPPTRKLRQEVYWMDVMMDNNWETCMA